jgi:hypothetical protein
MPPIPPVIPLIAALAAFAGEAPGPTVATEDTMRTEVPEVLVRAPRVTLDEILDRVARGEARRDSALRDMSFMATFRLMGRTNDPKKAPELLSETVLQVFKKKPDKVRSIVLRQFSIDPDDDEQGVDVEFRSGMDEQIVNFAFRPEARAQYRYEILGREVLGNHLIYRIGFTPRSNLDPSNPKGLVWIDTNEFVIVRQEVGFERSPVPLFLKGIDRMVIERKKYGDHWALNRVLLRASLPFALPIPKIGAKIGKSFDMTMFFENYQINSGLPDSLFASRKKS